MELDGDKLLLKFAKKINKRIKLEKHRVLTGPPLPTVRFRRRAQIVCLAMHIEKMRMYMYVHTIRMTNEILREIDISIYPHCNMPAVWRNTKQRDCVLNENYSIQNGYFVTHIIELAHPSSLFVRRLNKRIFEACNATPHNIVAWSLQDAINRH